MKNYCETWKLKKDTAGRNRKVTARNKHWINMRKKKKLRQHANNQEIQN